MATPRPSRRTIFAFPLMAFGWPTIAAPKPLVVTMLGDSITAGYGLSAKAALPVQLQLALQKRGIAAVVRAAGVSGDTSAGGLARVDFSVQKDTHLVIVALGGNDLLQGLDTKATRANLDAIVKRLKARNMAVLLAGIAAPREVGAAYARDFNALFASIAKARGVQLYPNLIEGAAQRPDLMQADAIHPNARGAALIAARLAPVVAKALKR